MALAFVAPSVLGHILLIMKLIKSIEHIRYTGSPLMKTLQVRLKLSPFVLFYNSHPASARPMFLRSDHLPGQLPERRSGSHA